MSWNHGYALDEYQTRKINGGDHGITWRDIFNAKVILKCCSELLTQWYVYFRCRFERPESIHSSTGFIFLGTAWMFWFRMNNIRDNRQASKDERFSSSSSIEIFRNPVGTINKIHKINTAVITEFEFEAVKSSSNYLTTGICESIFAATMSPYRISRRFANRVSRFAHSSPMRWNIKKNPWDQGTPNNVLVKLWHLNISPPFILRVWYSSRA